MQESARSSGPPTWKMPTQDIMRTSTQIIEPP
jgi:hypothetical protein